MVVAMKRGVVAKVTVPSMEFEGAGILSGGSVSGPLLGFVFCCFADCVHRRNQENTGG